MFRIGLARFDHVDRSPTQTDILDALDCGVKIKIDPDGNLWAKRLSTTAAVYLKPLYHNRTDDLFVIDDRPVKIFDIHRFRALIAVERQRHINGTDDMASLARRLQNCCMVCIKFGVEHPDLIQTPCWIIVVHLVAVELLNMVLMQERHRLHDVMHSSPSSSFINGHVSGGPWHHPKTMPPPQAPPPPPLMMSLPPQQARTRTGGAVSRRIASRQQQQQDLLISRPPMPPYVPRNTQQRNSIAVPDYHDYNSVRSCPHNKFTKSKFQRRFDSADPSYYQPLSERDWHELQWQRRNAAEQHRTRPTAASSMLDLRQINKYMSPPYFDRPLSTRGGDGHWRSREEIRTGIEGVDKRRRTLVQTRPHTYTTSRSSHRRQPTMITRQPTHISSNNNTDAGVATTRAAQGSAASSDSHISDIHGCVKFISLRTLIIHIEDE
jgi:hypothetical protein